MLVIASGQKLGAKNLTQDSHVDGCDSSYHHCLPRSTQQPARIRNQPWECYPGTLTTKLTGRPSSMHLLILHPDPEKV